MKGGFFVLALTFGALMAYADRISPSATITLDNGSPTTAGPDYDWTYTISVNDGDLGNVSSVEIFDVGGVVNVSAPCGSTCYFPVPDWSASYTSLGHGLYDVTFTNNYDNVGSSLDGFVIESTYHTGAQTPYSVTYSNGFDPGQTVGAPSAPTPEPASIGLTGLALLGLGAFKLRRS
jgi:hypothetical protein